MPDTAAFFVIIIVFASVLTILVPSGEYDRVLEEVTGRTLIVQ